MSKKICIWLIFALFPCASRSNPTQEARFYYFPQKSTLHGVLKQQKHFGPPGYGETPNKDSHITISVLELALPITVLPQGSDKDTPDSDPSYHVRTVQLFWDHGTDKLRPTSLLGKNIYVTGVLDERVATGQFTDVTMSVESFRIAK